MKAAAGLNEKGWTRKFPAEVSTLQDRITGFTSWGSGIKTYQFEIGDFVRCRTDGRVYQLQGYLDGGIYGDQGIWSEPAAGINPTVKTAYGEGGFGIQAGDYLGPWIYNEIRACLNLLVWTYHAAGTVPRISGHWGGGETYAAAVANYGTNPPRWYDPIDSGATFGAACHVVFRCLGDTMGDSYYVERYDGDITFQTVGGGGKAREVALWICPQRGSSPVTSFSDHGDGYSENIWCEYRTFGTYCAAHTLTATVGELAAHWTPSDPERPADNPYHLQNGSYTGYQWRVLGDDPTGLIICKWNVPGGYAYTAGT